MKTLKPNVIKMQDVQDVAGRFDLAHRKLVLGSLSCAWGTPENVLQRPAKGGYVLHFDYKRSRKIEKPKGGIYAKKIV